MGFLIVIYFICVTLTVSFIFSFYFIEKYVGESHPLMKWWRKHIVGLNPDSED
jgi:hypothetical protein